MIIYIYIYIREDQHVYQKEKKREDQHAHPNQVAKDRACKQQNCISLKKTGNSRT